MPNWSKILNWFKSVSEAIVLPGRNWSASTLGAFYNLCYRFTSQRQEIGRFDAGGFFARVSYARLAIVRRRVVFPIG